MSTQESRASSTSAAAASAAEGAANTSGAARERRRRWWLGRIEGAPVLRHLSLWQKLLIIVVVLLLPTGLLLLDFVGRNNEEIVRMRRDLCVGNYAQQLRRILSQQVAATTRAGLAKSEESPGGAKSALAGALAELGNLNTTGCGVDPGLARLRMPDTLASLRAVAALAADQPKGEARRYMREAVAAWFR